MARASVLLPLLAIAACAHTAHAAASASSVVFALNAGGPRVVSSSGVVFAPDDDSVTKAYPKGISAHVPTAIGRVSPQDQALYQTERYAQSSFGYSVPTPAPGDYVFVLKFAEVYWREAGKKLFDIRVGGKDVVRNLDIFGEVGYGAAHDVYVPLTVKPDGKLVIGKDTTEVGDDIRVEFLKKGDFDNPKICAIALVRGTIEDAKQLFPVAAVDQPEDDYDMNEAEKSVPSPPPISPSESSRKLKEKLVSQKRKTNPYADDGELPLVPIFLALVVIFGLTQAYRMFFPKAEKPLKQN